MPEDFSDRSCKKLKEDCETLNLDVIVKFDNNNAIVEFPNSNNGMLNAYKGSPGHVLSTVYSHLSQIAVDKIEDHSSKLGHIIKHGVGTTNYKIVHVMNDGGEKIKTYKGRVIDIYKDFMRDFNLVTIDG